MEVGSPSFLLLLLSGSPPTGACTACPLGAITLSSGATSATECGCATNYWGNPTTGGAGCLACPPNSVRAGFNTADTTSAGCTCDKGYWCAADWTVHGRSADACVGHTS